MRSVAFSPDGSILASGYDDKTIIIWDVETRTPLQELTKHTDTVWSVAFSPDGSVLASASSDKKVLLWDTESWTVLRTLNKHTWGVYSLSFSPDGEILASGSGDQSIILWHLATGIPSRTLEGHSSSVVSLAFSPDGAFLVSGSVDHSIKCWIAETGSYLGTLEGHSAWVSSLAFSPDGSTLASGSGDGTLVLWEPIQQSDLWWMETMTQDAEEAWWPPDEVLERVKLDYDSGIEARKDLFFASDPPDLDLFETLLTDWYSGPQLDFYQDRYLADLRAGAFTLNSADWEECTLEVSDFSVDGLEANVARTCRGGTCYHYDFAKEEMLVEEVEEMGTVVHRLRYDPIEDFWKTHAFVERIAPDASPPPTQGSDETSSSLITIGPPPNPSAFEGLMTMRFAVDEDQLNTMIQNQLDTEPVSTCPAIWVDTQPGEAIPTYFVYVSASEGDAFQVAIHTTASDIDPFGSVLIAVLMPGGNENVMIPASYQPGAGQPVPEEFVIKVVLAGCDIYEIVLPWP